MSYFVYIHECPNGKKYVGVTSRCVTDRWGNGKRYKNFHFSNAIKKYGWDNIKHKVFEVETKSEMFYLEKYLISYYQTTNPKYGYNKSTGGEGGTTGYHLSDECKKKISNLHRGNQYAKGSKRSKDFKEGVSTHWKNMPDEEREVRIKNLIIGAQRANKIRSKKVIVDGVLFDSKSEAARHMGKSVAYINNILNGSIKKVKYEIKEL